jgi:hypothetical protein
MPSVDPSNCIDWEVPMTNRRTFEIPSNSGDFSVIADAIPIDGQPSYFLDIQCRANCWWFRSDVAQKEDRWVTELHIEDVKVRHEELLALRSQVGKWNLSPFEFELSLGTRLRVSFAKRKDVISSVEKPVCSLAEQSSHLSADFRFVVDQTCMRALFDSLGWVEQEVF